MNIPPLTTIREAAGRLQGIVNQTPVMTSRTLNARVGGEVYFKCENFQRVGAFKFRGAYNALSQLSPAQRDAGVITHSSGNHAQGVALAASLLGIQAVVVMPEDAPEIKRAATAAYGARIVTCQAIEREQVSAQLVAEKGYTLIHPYDNHDIIAGQGTAAYELLSETGPLDLLFAPVGGGGLISGTALAAAALAPGCRVVGVEPEVADDANRSWRTGEIITLDQVPPTVADGLRTRFVGQRNLAVMREYVHDMTTVSEDDIYATLEFIWTYLKIIVEPSSAVALAPLFTGSYPVNGRRVGVILSGGNVNVPGCGFFHRPPPAARHEPPATSHPQPEPERPRILVLDPYAPAALEALGQVGVVDVRLEMSEETLLEDLHAYQALLVGPQRRLSNHVIKYGYNLRAIGCASSRLDNIDVSTAKALGIQVLNVPGGAAVAIAEHTLSSLLTLAEQFADGRLAGKTLGIIGFGAVGRQVAQRARAFNMRILVNQPRLTPELALDAGVEPTDLVDLLQTADFVTLHVPFKRETDAIIGAEELALMPSTALLINAGHTDLVDEAALLDALNNRRLAGAALPALPPQVAQPGPSTQALRAHPRVLVAPHVSTILHEQQQDLDLNVAHAAAAILARKPVSETLALELAPIGLVTPHEQIDEKRVERLMSRLETEERLVNPPISTFWKGKYVILDGATRFTSLQRLGYPHVIVQVVPPQDSDFELHTWYHAISHPTQPFSALAAVLNRIEHLALTPLPGDAIANVLETPGALCYFLDRAGQAMLARVAEGADRLQVMNDLVNCYNGWGEVERTLLTDPPRLLVQFPQMQAVAIFPQFKPEEVFDAAAQGNFLPAGLTRFVIPGRILRLNASLARLKQDEPLAEKRAWFNQFLAEKLARSRLRYYQEPVVLLDE
jgi:threo-3-hydroxy-L-aspartate ammonia-lyase